MFPATTYQAALVLQLPSLDCVGELLQGYLEDVKINQKNIPENIAKNNYQKYVCLYHIKSKRISVKTNLWEIEKKLFEDKDLARSRG